MPELKPATPEFDDIADMFWRLGVMYSPSHLQGYLAGMLAVGFVPPVEQWPDQAAALMETVEPPNNDERQLLLNLYQTVCHQLLPEAMSFTLLLPDDAAEVTQRIDCLGQWCRGFLSGFAMGGKELQQQAGPRQYSEEVSEVLNDMGAISQIGLSNDDSDTEQREQNYFEICEYLRVAAMNIYLDCNKRLSSQSSSLPSTDSGDDKTVSSPANLFSKPGKQLH